MLLSYGYSSLYSLSSTAREVNPLAVRKWDSIYVLSEHLLLFAARSSVRILTPQQEVPVRSTLGVLSISALALHPFISHL